MRLRYLAVLALALLVTPAFADPISAPTTYWYEYGFGASGPAFACPSCVPGANSVFAPDPAWTFTLAAPGWLIVTDAFLIGDEFEVFDFGSSIGFTTVAPDTGTCGSDPDTCLGLASYGYFYMDAGGHSITIDVVDSPYGGGAAYFRVTDVPEPASLLLMGTGLIGLASRFRRKKS